MFAAVAGAAAGFTAALAVSLWEATQVIYASFISEKWVMNPGAMVRASMVFCLDLLAIAFIAFLSYRAVSSKTRGEPTDEGTED